MNETSMPRQSAVILVVDDVAENIDIVGNTLIESGYEVMAATNGFEAIEKAREHPPDLILLDVVMPELHGYDTCRLLKNEAQLADIPVVFLTAKDNSTDVIEGFEAGAVDYISKPFNSLELSVRVQTHLELKYARESLQRMNRQLIAANTQILQKNQKLREAQKKLELAAHSDPLTGLANRRCMIERLSDEVYRFKRTPHRFGLIMCDIDNFKQFNDSYGHDVGDFVLRSIAAAMSGIMRGQDTVARWGGEEFLIFLPETDIQGATATAEKIRSSVQSQTFIYKDLNLDLTLTFGVSEYCDSTTTIDECIRHADVALYHGKNSGKNCVVQYLKEFDG